MKNKSSNQEMVLVVKIALIIIIVSGVANCGYLLSIPSDAKNEILLNLSANRLLLVGFLVIGISLSIFAFFIIHKTPQKYAESIFSLYQKPIWVSVILIFSLILTCITWIAFYSPTYLLGKYYSIFERLRPIFLWVQTVSTILLLLGIYLNNRTSFDKVFSNNKKYMKLMVITTAVLITLFFIIGFVYPRLTEDLWFGRYSVPILTTQIFFSWMLVTALKQITHGTDIKIPSFLLRNIDWIAFILIWSISVVLWVKQPIEFMDDLYFTAIEQHLRAFPPTHEIFPWKDSRTYYYITESIKIGEGIYRSIDKSLFLSIGSVINWLAGGSYVKMLNLQVVILALFPPVVYLIGKELYSRYAGLMGAVLAVMQEINAIRIMDEFPVVSSKVFLSEPYMQLWTGLIVLTAIIAFKNQSKKQAQAFLICGSVLGVSTLFRLNTFVIIPFLLIIIFIYFKKNKKLLLKSTSLFLVGLLLALTPWMIHNSVKYNDPFAFIKTKVRGVIINKRYEKITGQGDLQSNEANNFPGIVEVPSDFNNSQLAYTTDKYIAQKTLQNNTDLTYVLSMQVGAGGAAGAVEIQEELSASLQSSMLLTISNYIELPLSVLRHFLNNIITSFSILPTSIIPQDLFHGSRTQRFWGGFDANLYEGINPILLIINLLVISIGISKAIEKSKIAGLVPVAVYLGYHLSNGLAISSGNRYTQPASWMIFLYYSIGLIVISDWFIQLINNNSPIKTIEPSSTLSKKLEIVPRTRSWLIIAFTLIVGSIPIAADLLPVNRYPKSDNEKIALAIIDDSSCQDKIVDAGFGDVGEFSDLINGEGYSASIGRILDLRQLNKEEFEIIFKKSKRIIKREGMFFTFSLLSPKYRNPQQMIFYYDDSDINLSNGSDAVILSNEGSEVIAIGVIDLQQPLQSIPEDLFEISFDCYIAEKQ